MRRLFVLLLASVAAAPVAARAEIIEKVVAKVNGQIITLSEFQNRQIAAAQAARVDPAAVGPFLRQNNARILQEAIDDILLLQKAEDAGMRLRPEYIDEVIDGIKKENKITSEEQFQDALAREGLTLGELRQNIERSMTRRMVMQRDIEPKISPTDGELRAEYEKLKATDFTKRATVSLQEIVVSEEQGGLAAAKQIVEKARGGADFQELARSHSSAPSRRTGGDLGAIAQGDMAPDLERAAFALPVGEVSDPLPVEGGFRIFKVTAKTSGSTTPYEDVKERVRERLMMSRFEKEYEAYMAELRKTAQVEVRVREVPLQLTGPIPQSTLLEALEPLAPGAEPEPGPALAAPSAAPAAAPATSVPAPGTSLEDEIQTTPQAAPEKVAPPPLPGSQTPPPPPSR